MQLVLLALWATTGIAIAWSCREPGERVIDWAVFGVVFGPFWLPVAVDRRQRQSHHRPDDLWPEEVSYE